MKLMAALLILTFHTVGVARADESNTDGKPTAFVGAYVGGTIDSPADMLAAATNIDVTSQELAILTIPLRIDELERLAKVWQGHLKASVEKAARLSLALNGANKTLSAQLRADLDLQADEQLDFVDRYKIVIDQWELKGASAEDLAGHRAYLRAVRLEGLKVTDIQTFIGLSISWLFSLQGGAGFLLKVAGSLAAMWGIVFFARFARRSAGRALDEIADLSQVFKSFASTVVFWATTAVGATIMLALLGMNVTALFAVFGGLSIILGLALQETLSNIASGLLIIVVRPFDAGDFVQTAGATGYVEQVTIVSTKIRTVDNQMIVVPNSKVWGGAITNVDSYGKRRVDIVLSVGYSEKIPRVIEALRSLLATNELCLKDPAPQVFVGELSDSSVKVFCRPWALSEDYWNLYWELTGRAREILEAEGLKASVLSHEVVRHKSRPN